MQDTIAVDFSRTQNHFLGRLEFGSTILDFGCGSGRDTKYFIERGFKVEATDEENYKKFYASFEENSDTNVRLLYEPRGTQINRLYLLQQQPWGEQSPVDFGSEQTEKEFSMNTQQQQC